MTLRNIWTALFAGKRPRLSAGISVAGDRQPPEGFKDPEELAAHITAGLQQPLPEGWRVKRLRSKLAWAVVNERPKPGEWPTQQYDVWVTEDLRWLIITHDNRDIGMGPLFQHALVLSTSQLRGGKALSAAVEQALSRFKPNEWGYT